MCLVWCCLRAVQMSFALPVRSMAGLGPSQCFGVDPIGKFEAGGSIASATGSSRSTPGGRVPRKQKPRHLEDTAANSSELLDSRLEQGSRDSGHKRIGKLVLWNTPGKPRLGSAIAQWTGLPEAEMLSSSRHCRLADEFHRLCAEGQLHKALAMLRSMDQEGKVPSANLYRCLLKACVERKALAEARQVHAHLAEHGLESSRVLGEHLVCTFVKCGGLEDALQAFRRLPHRTAVSWTAVMSGYTTAEQGLKALEMYHCMREQGVKPDRYTFVSLLRACGSISDLEEGRRMHAEASKYRYDSDLFVGTCLVDMYGKCGSIVDARNVFDGLSRRDVVTWNAMLAAYVQQGQAEKALQLYDQMWKDGANPNSRTFVGALQACGILAEKDGAAALERGKALHADAQREGYDSDLFLGSTLVSMYGKCGSIVDAQYVFDGLSKRNVVSWNAMLAAYAQQGQAEKVLQLYKQMQNERVSPNDRTFVTALQACGILADKEDVVAVEGQLIKLKSLQQGKAIHDDVRRKNYDSNMFVGNTLVSMYRKCGTIVDAQNAFERLSMRDVVSWKLMLNAYAQQGQAEKALHLYEEMKEEGVSPDVWTVVSALQACAILAEHEEDAIVDREGTRINCLDYGKMIHADAQRTGFDSDTFVVNTLISMYGKCGSFVDAQHVFDGMSQREVVSWNAMLKTCAQHGEASRALQIYVQMQEEGASPDDWSFVSSLQACGMLAEVEVGTVVDGQLIKVNYLEKGMAIHFEARQKGYDSDVFVGNTLVSMYGKCGNFMLAQYVFDGLCCHDLVSWNVMLMVYIQQGKAAQALQLYELMGEEGVSPDVWTFVSTLQACGLLAQKEEDGVVDGYLTKVKHLTKGKVIHAEACMKGYKSDIFLGCTLIGMYGKCGNLVEAHDVFNRLTHQTEVAWTAMLAASIEQGQGETALQLYEEMLQEGVSPDVQSFVNVLQACRMLAGSEEDGVVDGRAAKLKSLEMGKAIHAHACSKGYESNVFLISTLISMYGTCGSTLDAQHVFDGFSSQSVVAWNSLLSVYVEQGQAERALQLYRQMQEEGLIPDEVTLVCSLKACSDTGSLEMCKEIHGSIISTTRGLSPLLATTLIHAYGSCASMVDAQDVFDTMPHPDVVSWNALIAGYARQGQIAASLLCFKEMVQRGVNPDGTTFLALLSACSYAGLVDAGVEYFQSMSRQHGLTPQIEHYVGLVDLLGRAGYWTIIEDLMSTIPMQPNLSMLLCLLGACRKHGKLVLGKQAFDEAVHLQPRHPAAYVLMSNIYADAGFMDSSKEVMELRQKAGARKKPGQTWIEHEHGIITFLVGDQDYLMQESLYNLLGRVAMKLKHGLPSTF